MSDRNNMLAGESQSGRSRLHAAAAPTRSLAKDFAHRKTNQDRPASASPLTSLFLINGLGMGNSTRCYAVIQRLAASGVEALEKQPADP